MKKRMRRLASLLAACALCISCVQMSDVYASDEIISDAEVIQEGIDVTTADEELVSADAIIQASKSSEDGEYVGGAGPLLRAVRLIQGHRKYTIWT